MSNAQAVVRAQLLGQDPPPLPELVGSLNRLICQLTSPGQYITAVFGFYDRQSQLFSFVNAGHLPVLVLRADGRQDSYPESDPVVGVLPDIPYSVHQVPVSPGDTLFFYTDGITECWSPTQEMFGYDRMVEALATCHHQPVDTIIPAMLESLKQYRASAEQSDDITMLVLQPR